MPGRFAVYSPVFRIWPEVFAFLLRPSIRQRNADSPGTRRLQRKGLLLAHRFQRTFL